MQTLKENSSGKKNSGYPDEIKFNTRLQLIIKKVCTYILNYL